MEIQGSGQFSPLAGERVETTGVVTLFTASGASLWLQDPGGDGDSATSDGIFVSGGGFPLSGPRPSVGDEIRIVATAEEQQFPPALPLTRLRTVEEIEILSSDNPPPAPVPLTDLPGASIPEGIAFWEPFEGMLASVTDASVVAPTTGFGEFVVLAEADAVPGSGYFPQTKQLLVRDLGGGQVDYNPERIMVDDTSLSQAIQVMPGDVVLSLTGTVDYTFGNYKLQPLSGFELETHRPPKPPAGTRSGPKGDTTVTTFNVENLFDLVDDPVKDDESSTPTPEALETKLAKLSAAIRVELRLPEILVVQEIENTQILQELGGRVNAAAGTDYVATSFETSDARGIEPGLLWDADRVSLEDAFQLSGPDVEAAFGPSSASPGREPLVGVFDVEGNEVTIVANHFKSKSGDDPLFGVNQPPTRITEEQRKLQAQVVRDFVDGILEEDPSAMVMVAGDLNDFQFGEPGEGPDHPIAILEGGAGQVPLTNLVGMEKPAETFTFVFDGNSQVLDHMLVSPALLNLAEAADVLHVNSPFPESLSGDPETPLRAADHDPLEGRFSFG
jgi:predicted extracellular nuclease